MAFDGMFIAAMISQLQFLNGASVSKIAQPFADEVVLTLRKNRTNHHLLLVANPKVARFALIEQKMGNQTTTQNFLMLLRKHLEKTTLTQISQLENDRVVNFEFSGRNDLGDETKLVLSLEVMGRHSNLILYNSHTNQIIDTIRHVSIAQNRFRTLLPQASYRTPPKQDKLILNHTTFDQLVALIANHPNCDDLASALIQTYQGFGKTLATIFAQMCLSLGASSAFAALNDAIKAPRPTLLATSQTNGTKTKHKTDFSFIAPLDTSSNYSVASFGRTTIKQTAQKETLSQLVNAYFEEQARSERVAHNGKKLLHTVKQALKRNETKLVRQQNDLKKSHNAAEFKLKGELLTTFMYQVKHGASHVVLNNYYANDEPINIKLNPEISAAKNAQRYFKRYSKLKNSVAVLTKQIEHTKAEVAYLTAVLNQINQAKPADLADIEVELKREHYLPEEHLKSGKKRRIQLKAKPQVYLSADGTKISVGKSNLQNERLTLKTAKKDEWWLHTKDIPGAHVIIHTNTPSEQTLLQAAQLAAYFSKFAASQNVPVDYTQVKWIKKPKNTKPGFVTYTHQKTLFVTPDKTAIASMPQE